MWTLHTKSKEYHSRPSDQLCIADRLAAYQLDSAVWRFGAIVENALLERVNVGDSERSDYRAKYTLNQLLDPDFRLPDPGAGDDIESLFGADGMIFDEVG